MSFNGHKKCLATSKRSGQKCKNIVVKGKQVCKFHGGKSLKGSQHPNFSHGFYSQYLPKDLALRLVQLTNDQELSDLREELALLTIQIQQLLDKMTANISEEKANSIWAKIVVAIEQKRRVIHTLTTKQILERTHIPISEAASFAVSVMEIVQKSVRGTFVEEAVMDKLRTLVLQTVGELPTHHELKQIN